MLKTVKQRVTIKFGVAALRYVRSFGESEGGSQTCLRRVHMFPLLNQGTAPYIKTYNVILSP